MKFISFLHDNQAKFGIVNNQAITDLTDKIYGAKTLKNLIEKKRNFRSKKICK